VTNKAQWQRRAWLLLLFGTLLSGLVARFMAVPTLPTTWDEVDFTCALRDYDLSAHAPHWPGYPAYVLLARLFAVAVPARYALALPGILSSLLLSLAIVKFSYRRLSPQVALSSAFLLSFSPLLISESARPMADSLAMAMAVGAWLCLCSCQKRSWLFAAVLLGLLPAVKADHGLLCFLILLAPKERRAQALGALLLTFLAWQILFFGIVDCQSWIAEGSFFLSGHFSDWGGSAHTTNLSFLERFTRCFEIFGHSGLAVPKSLLLPFFLWLLYFLFMSRKSPNSSLVIKTVLSLTPMALWVLLGQNLEHPRHGLIFLPFLLLLASASASNNRVGQLCLLIVVSGLVYQLPRTINKEATKEGFLELNEYFHSSRWKRVNEDKRIRVYLGESARLLKQQHPRLDIRRARSWAGVKEDLESDPSPPERIYVSSEVRKNEAIKSRAVFCGQYPCSYRLLIWDFTPPPFELPLPSDD
jgi:hypothetical protein